MRAALPVLAALALAGCLGTSAPDPSALALPALSLSDAVRIDAEQPAREPSIVEAPDGALYVAGFWGFGRHTEYRGTVQNILQGPLVWKSTDEGATWTRLEPGLPVDGAISNSDLDLAVDADGTLYLAALSYYSLPMGAPDVATTLTVTIGATRDGGASWTWTRLDQGPARSHPWVVAAPDGRAHVVWADGMGIRHATSDDRGATWAEQGRVTGDGEAGGIVAHGDALAVRVAPINARDPAMADGVAVSDDGGAAWHYEGLPGDRAGDDAPDGFGSVAFDAAGVLYAAWSEDRSIVVGRSRDLGASWELFPVVREPEGSVPYYPFLRAGAAGELGVTWFTLTDDVVAARAAHVLHADARPAMRVFTYEADTGGLNHADYYQLAILRGGDLAAAVPVTTEDMGQWFDYRVAR